MKNFMDRKFLLNSDTALELYYDYAARQPIIDYHCHINPAEIADNKQFRSVTEAWLGGDHYKWRLMRANGVDERLITGDGDDREKFRAFAACLEKAAGNPIYHWAHLELRRYFGYEGVLCTATADEAYDLCNKVLTELRVRDMIERSNVELICTTDDPCDDLAAHLRIREDDSFRTRVVPGWRPDKAVNITKPGFCEYISLLSQVSDVQVNDMDSLFKALSARLDYFEAAGCNVSDHGLDFIPFMAGGEADGAKALSLALAGKPVSAALAEAYQFTVLKFLGGEYARRGWIMQLHYGALRNTNTRMFERLGPDTGYDTIGRCGDPVRITGFLNSLEEADNLPKTVIYSLNPNDNAMLATIIGSFQGGCPGKLQHGSAWWFNDTKTGMEAQITSLAELGLLGNFVGMLTDSRSFLSYTRHEYFRRILCNLVGGWIENGELPMSGDAGKLVADISYRNIKEYLK